MFCNQCMRLQGRDLESLFIESPDRYLSLLSDRTFVASLPCSASSLRSLTVSSNGCISKEYCSHIVSISDLHRTLSFAIASLLPCFMS